MTLKTCSQKETSQFAPSNKLRGFENRMRFPDVFPRMSAWASSETSNELHVLGRIPRQGLTFVLNVMGLIGIQCKSGFNRQSPSLCLVYQ